MNTTTYSSTEPYWNMLKDLSVENKIALINRLSNSIVLSTHSKKGKNTLNKCFGSWETNNEYTTDELLKDIDITCSDKTDFINQFLK